MFYKIVLFVLMQGLFFNVQAQESSQVLLFEPAGASPVQGKHAGGAQTGVSPVQGKYVGGTQAGVGSVLGEHIEGRQTGSWRSVEAGKFEKTVKSAIKSLEDSIRDTCVKQMETSISVTAEGKWAVVGVSITGAMSLIILNPKMSKNCGK